MSEFLAQLPEIIVAFFLLVGAGLMLLAAVGLLRLPDLPTRMHASSKAGSLGAALTVLAVAVFLPEPAVIARALATVVFLLLTAPVAAHVIGRASYFVGVPLWEGTVKDDLAAQYDHKTHRLASGAHADKEIEGVEPFEKEPVEPPADVELGPEPSIEEAEEPESIEAPEPAEPKGDVDLETPSVAEETKAEETEDSDVDDESDESEDSEVVKENGV